MRTPDQSHPHQAEEFVTIIGANAEEISRTFHKDGLAAKGFAVLHRMGIHRFALPEGSPLAALMGNEPMLAATYMRRAPR